MKAKEFLISYLEKETDFYNSEKVDGYGVMKVDNFVSVIEQYANQRVIKELERTKEILLAITHNVDNTIISEDAIYSINQSINKLTKLF